MSSEIPPFFHPDLSTMSPPRNQGERDSTGASEGQSADMGASTSSSAITTNTTSETAEQAQAKRLEARLLAETAPAELSQE